MVIYKFWRWFGFGFGEDIFWMNLNCNYKVRKKGLSIVLVENSIMKNMLKDKRNLKLVIIAIVVVVLVLLCVFWNYLRAYQMGIDVKYLDDPRYCINHTDCTSTIDCEPVNIYNHDEKDGVCEDVVKNKGTFHYCHLTICKIDSVKIGDI